MYKCDICNYQTNNKQSFNNHINRKVSCSGNKQKLHGNANKIVRQNPKCEVCEQYFASNQSLVRHNKSQHATINGNHNNQTINENCHNTNITINPTIIIHPFTTYDIFDLTIYEQYRTLSSEVSPYTSILDHYNLNPNRPQYHNMNLGNIKTNIMDVHDGTKWEKESIACVLNLLVPTHQDLIGALLNRFRIFINVNALKLIPLAIYYGCAENLKYYKQIILSVKLHIYNNRHKDRALDLNIPEDENDKIFWAISKNFIWPEIEHLITELDKYKIDFDQNLGSIKNQILASEMKTTAKNDLYKKLIKRINNLITTFESNHNEQDKSTSSSDTLSSESGHDLDVCSTICSEKNHKKSKYNSHHDHNNDLDVCSKKNQKKKSKKNNFNTDSNHDSDICSKESQQKFNNNSTSDSNHDSDSSSNVCLKENYAKSKNNRDSSDSDICSKKINNSKKYKNSSDDNDHIAHPKKNNKKSKNNCSDSESETCKGIQKKSKNNSSDSESEICMEIYKKSKYDFYTAPKKISSSKKSKNSSDEDYMTFSKKMNRKKSKKDSSNSDSNDICHQKLAKKTKKH